MNTNACPNELNPTQSFLTFCCSCPHWWNRSESISISFSHRSNIRVIFRFVKLSPIRPNALSQSLLATRWFLWARFPIHTTHPILIGRRARLMSVIRISIIAPIVISMIVIQIWGITLRRRLSPACQTASAPRSIIFCFSPGWTPIWYSIGRRSIFFIDLMRKFSQSFCWCFRRVIPKRYLVPIAAIVIKNQIPITMRIDCGRIHSGALSSFSRASIRIL